MTTLLQLPKLHYIVFQLIRFEVTDRDIAQGAVSRNAPQYTATSTDLKNSIASGATQGVSKENTSTQASALNKGYSFPVETDVVVMTVFPSLKEYQYSGRKEYMAGIGDNNITVIKGGLAPRKITLEGTFGMRTTKVGLKTQTGAQRLEEFRQVFLKSQAIDPLKPSDVPEGKKYVYGMNFYDFTEPYWGSVELDTLIIRSDAKTSNRLPMYKIQFTGLGKLIDVDSKDPIVKNLGYAIQLQEVFEGVNASIDNYLRNSGLNEIVTDWQMASDAVDAANEMISTYASILGGSNLPLSAKTGIISPLTTIVSTGIPLLLASSQIKQFGDLL